MSGMIVAFLLVLAGMAFIELRNIGAGAKPRAINCGKNLSQIVQAMLAYSQAEKVAWPTPWAQGPGLTVPKIGNAHVARSITCRGFEMLAASQTMPAVIFHCTAVPKWPQERRKPAGDDWNGGRWGMGPEGFVTYAWDWVSPAHPDATRPLIADRQAGNHPGGTTMVAYGDGHAKAVVVTLRPTSLGLVTEGCDGNAVFSTTAGSPQDDDIYSADGDGGDPLTPEKGDPLRAWVK